MQWHLLKTLGRVAPRAAFSRSCVVCPSVREEAPSLSSHRTRPSFATHPDSFKKGREYALQRRGMRISSSVLPIQFRVVSRLSVLHPGEASSGRVPPSLPVAFCSPSLSTQGRLSGQRRERKKESLLRRSLHCPLYNTIRGTDAGLKSTIHEV